jgi:hypothetical protein
MKTLVRFTTNISVLLSQKLDSFTIKNKQSISMKRSSFSKIRHSKCLIKKLKPGRGQDQGASLETNSKPLQNTGRARAAGSFEDSGLPKQEKGMQFVSCSK